LNKQAFCNLQTVPAPTVMATSDVTIALSSRDSATCRKSEIQHQPLQYQMHLIGLLLPRLGQGPCPVWTGPAVCHGHSMCGTHCSYESTVVA